MLKISPKNIRENMYCCINLLLMVFSLMVGSYVGCFHLSLLDITKKEMILSFVPVCIKAISVYFVAVLVLCVVDCLAEIRKNNNSGNSKS